MARHPMTHPTDAELRTGLLACLAVPRWVDDVTRRAPYSSLDALIDVARSAASPLSPAEVDEALADHPRIGEKHAGAGRSSAFSASEQASSQSSDEMLAAALLDGNRAYEQRFGRVFLIRAAGRSRAEILAELHRRLELDDETESFVVGSELREIALLRIRSLFAPAFDDASAARPTEEKTE
ncbi:2-oxo-4-hydroxy-4-carboxy-5-ureidoimidazoline decarboxylase [Microbacteriaceae bacterium VKM Ac-2855]|nr:2-oxo-4-hydroxy-4-carboxy-5-ureidoimidazoline decarboxylase [Microbacteriaceae bacterium VKM Ac-2855]